MLDVLTKLPKFVWIMIIVICGCIATPIGIGVAALIFKSNNLSFERGETKINIGKAKNNSDYAKKQWEQKLKDFELQLEGINTPEIETVKESFESELKPTAEAVIEYTEEFEDAIAF